MELLLNVFHRSLNVLGNGSPPAHVRHFHSATRISHLRELAAAVRLSEVYTEIIWEYGDTFRRQTSLFLVFGKGIASSTSRSRVKAFWKTYNCFLFFITNHFVKVPFKSKRIL